MKRVYYIMIFVGVLMFFQVASAQERTRQRPQQGAAQSSGLPELSVRARNMNESQTQQTEDAPWLREVYRMVNLKEEANAPLYYPVEPVGDRMNLFTIIFRLLLDNKITAYQYLDGREVFTDEYKLNFKETLDRFRVLYKEQKSGAVTRYTVDDSDVPSAEVLSFLIKEAWYYNKSNSTVDIKLLAICPVLLREGDFGELAPMPMFWLPYENIRPYISQKTIMTSNANNAMLYTMDDYFRKRMFKGEIIKTTNLLNYNLAQQYGETPESLKHAQDSIENQLKSFEQELWVKPDTTHVAEKGKNKETKSSSSSRSSSSTKEQKTKEPKPQKSKSEKSSTTPTRSVRRTR